MIRKSILTISLVVFLFSLTGCVDVIVETPTVIEKVDTPLYGIGNLLTIDESDLNALIEDFIGSEYTTYESIIEVSAADQLADEVQRDIEEKLNQTNWRLEQDWSDVGAHSMSRWQKDDLQLIILTFDNLSTEDIRVFKLAYGIDGLNESDTMTLAHIITLDPELPELASTPEAPSSDEADISFEPTSAIPDPDNLIINGYFLEAFDGWQRQLVDEGGSSKAKIADFGSSKFNRALHVEHEGLGEVYFYQDVDVPSSDVTFSCSFNTNSTEGPIFGFSGTGFALIVLIYQDAQGNDLGFTRIINFNENLFAGTAFVGAPEKLSDTNTSHNYQVESEKTYVNYEINIQKELDNNLLGIESSEVDSILILLIVGANDKGASAELKISDLVLKEN